MDLLRTQKIRYLTNVYRKMKCPLEKYKRIQLIDEVAEILLKEERTKGLEELLDLLGRERNLIACNMTNKTLEMLRLRQLNLFIDFIKGHGKPLKKAGDIKKILCKQCKSVKTLEEFELHTRQSGVNICQTCAFLKVPPVDVTIYRAMLRAIQRDERKRGALSSFAFIVQEEDIREIIETIWHGHSILSQCDVRTELKLPRWNQGDDWAPWNCVCLTDEETRAHVKLVCLEDMYNEFLLNDIQKKQYQAKLAFKKLENIDFDFVETGEWWNIGLDGKLV